MQLTRVALLTAALASATALAGSTPHDDPATRTVEGLHAALLAVMQAADLDPVERGERLKDTIEASFDVSTIVRLSLGRFWHGLQPEERERLEQAQFELILSTYAARFHSYDGERFVTLMTERGPTQTRVRTRIEAPQVAAVSLDYLLRESDDQPRIFNVMADGFSELSMRRAEYTAIFERGGLDALLAEIERLVQGNLQRGR